MLEFNKHQKLRVKHIRSCRNFPAVIRDREEKKVIVILSSFLRHFYFQPFSLQSKKNSATERKEKNRRLACHMLSSLSLSQTLWTVSDSDCENKTGSKVLGSLTQTLTHLLREGGERCGIVPVVDDLT